MHNQQILDKILHVTSIIPAIGIISGFLFLPFLNKETTTAQVIAAYTLLSIAFVYTRELLDWHSETSRYHGLPDDAKSKLILPRVIVPLHYICLTLIYTPMVLYAYCNFWTNLSIHGGILFLTLLVGLVSLYLDDITDYNEEICDDYYFGGELQ